MEITELFAHKLVEIGPDYRRAAEIAAERLKHFKPFFGTDYYPRHAYCSERNYCFNVTYRSPKDMTMF